MQTESVTLNSIISANTMKSPFLPIEEAPFLRILLPFTAGILLQHLFPHYLFIYLFLFLGSLFSIKYYISKSPHNKFENRSYFGIAVSSFCISLGIAALFLQQQKDSESLKLYPYALATITKEVKQTDKSIRFEALITGWHSPQKEKIIPENKPVILYFRPDELSRSLISGNKIIFKQNLALIANSKNPESFDYASFMRYKGFVYTQYLDSKDWKRLGYKEDKSISASALKLRDHISERIKRSGLSQSSSSILCALLLGDTQDITTDVRSRFSTSGISHILAVSGLHTGVIWAILYFILTPIVWIRITWLRPALVLILIWAYAFVTGLSPSVIRASIMISFILTGQIINRKGSTLNSLFVAAFFMLLFQPYYLFNVSFQLSFVAVFSILYIYPFLNTQLELKKKWLSGLWSILCVSAAAQIGTLPLSIYYFHELPLFSLPVNLIVIPVLPFILGAGILVLLLNILQLPANIIIRGLDEILNCLNRLTEIIYETGFSSVKNIWMEPHFLLFWFILIFTLFWAFRTRRSDVLIFSVLFTSLFLTADTLYYTPPARNIWLIYQNNQSTAYNFIDDNTNYIFIPNQIETDSTIQKIARNFWMKNDLGNVIRIQDHTSTNSLFIDYPYIQFRTNKILVLNSMYWKSRQSRHKLHVDYAVISHGFSGKLSDICKLFNIKEVILCSDLNHFKQMSLQKECLLMGIPFYSIKKQGAWILDTDSGIRIPATTED